MKALLLAAGLGTRLKPVTDHIPKCLVPISGRPLLGYWLDLLAPAGIKEFYINLHYHAQAVQDFVASTPHAARVTFLNEDELLGTGGTLKKNADLFTDAPFFLAHADNLCLTDFHGFIATHRNRPPNVDITMMTFNPPDPRQCGVVETNARGVVTSFHEKVENPPTMKANGAVFVMDPDVARYARTIDKDHFEISLDILPHYLGRMQIWHNADYHLDIGTPDAYQKAQDDNERVQALYQKFKGA